MRKVKNQGIKRTQGPGELAMFSNCGRMRLATKGLNMVFQQELWQPKKPCNGTNPNHPPQGYRHQHSVWSTSASESVSVEDY